MSKFVAGIKHASNQLPTYVTGTAFESDGVGTSPLICSSSDFVPGHPIQHLAPEILGEIFIRCLPYPSNLTSFKDAPLLLLHVCRHWRQTARWTPHLWTDLNLTLKIKFPPARVFQMWLDNAGTLLLQVSLPGYTRDPKQAEEVIELLLDNFHRISELKGTLTPWFSTILLRHALPIRAPSLRRLNVSGWDKLPSQSDLERLRKCMIVPQLEVCNLNSLRFQLSLLSLDPARLRELCGLWVIEVAEFESMEILTSLSSLQRLSVFLHSPLDVSVLKIPSIIPIPSLRHLQISTFTEYDPNVFLKELDVAFVEHLEIYSGDSSLGSLLDTLTGGKIFPLKSLTLIGYNITASEWLPWFRKFMQLEKLTLGRGTIDVETLISLTTDSSSSPTLWICPVLSTLHLRGLEFSWEAMADLILSRAPTGDGGGHLGKVIFGASKGLKESDRAAFTMIQEGSRGLIEIEFIPEASNYYTCLLSSHLLRVDKSV